MNARNFLEALDTYVCGRIREHALVNQADTPPGSAATPEQRTRYDHCLRALEQTRKELAELRVGLLDGFREMLLERTDPATCGHVKATPEEGSTRLRCPDCGATWIGGRWLWDAPGRINPLG